MKWFESYLSNRKQYVTYNGMSSSQQRIKCGVPQGSILGPLLFFIHINDLCQVCKHTSGMLVADDTNLFSNGTDLKSLESTTNNFATDCPCDVWCRGLTICLLYVGPPFGYRFLNNSWAVGLTEWIVYLHFLYFDICNHICLDMSYIFFALSLLLKYFLFFQVLMY